MAGSSPTERPRRTPLRRKTPLRRQQPARKPIPAVEADPALWHGHLQPQLRETARFIGKPPGRREDIEYRRFVASHPCLSCGATVEAQSPRPSGGEQEGR